jgi:hypothetical protein
MPIRIGNEILIDYLAAWHYHSGNKTAYGRKRNMAGAAVSSRNFVLSLIEAVSTEDDVSLGEIDAFIFCNYANDGWELDDLQSWGPGDYFVQKANRLVVPVPKYTRFANVQKLLRPPGWVWQAVSQSPNAQSEAVSGTNVFRSPVLVCEHLSWLHVLVQVIDFDRQSAANASPKPTHDIVISGVTPRPTGQSRGSMTPQPVRTKSSFTDSVRA